MIRFFAVVNYMVRTFSFCSNLYADVIANIILLHIFINLKIVFNSWNMILKLKSFIQMDTYIIHKKRLTSRVAINFVDETRGDFIWYQSSYNSNQSESNLRHLNFDPYPSRTRGGPWVTLVATHATMRMSLIFKCPIISIVSELSGFWGVSTIKWNSYPTLL